MTVIATDGRSMASDGLVMQQDTIIDLHSCKVQRLNTGGLYGSAGDCVIGDEIQAWLENPDRQEHEFPGREDEPTRAIHLRQDGMIELYETGCGGHPVIVSAPMAIGAGMDFAMAALDAGASVERAVEIAIKRSPYCGGGIYRETLGTK